MFVLFEAYHARGELRQGDVRHHGFSEVQTFVFLLLTDSPMMFFLHGICVDSCYSTAYQLSGLVFWGIARKDYKIILSHLPLPKLACVSERFSHCNGAILILTVDSSRLSVVIRQVDLLHRRKAETLGM